MKIRNGFVSNSSSSSFVILGRKCNYNDDGVTYVLGNTLNEGQDFFELTEEIKKFINETPQEVKSELLSNFTFYKVYKQISESEVVKKESLPNEFEIFSFEKDNYCTESLDQFIENYINEKMAKYLLRRNIVK